MSKGLGALSYILRGIYYTFWRHFGAWVSDMQEITMNFQDLFARYREMGAMAPQQSLDEQLFKRGQNATNCSWTLSEDHPTFSMDLPTQVENNGGTKKERIMFKLPSPNTFRAFLMHMDEEHEQQLSRDEEVEELLQPRPQQQGWNLGVLKTNSLCKDYYKLTSNVLRTLVMGIKEIADGEISPACNWQIAQERPHQKQSNLSNIFLQDAACKTEEVPYPVCCSHGDGDEKQELDRVMSEAIRQSPIRADNGGTPLSRDGAERSKENIRRWLWGQLVPNTCLGVNLDPRQDGEKTMRVVQDSRMKVMNTAGFAVTADNYSNAFPEICQMAVKPPPDHNVPEGPESSNDLGNKKPSRMINCAAPQNIDDESFRDMEEGNDGGQQEQTKPTNGTGSTEEKGIPVGKEQLRPTEVEGQSFRKHRSGIRRETRFEEPKLHWRDRPAPKGTRFALESQQQQQQQQHTIDGDFKPIPRQSKSPPLSPAMRIHGFVSDEHDSFQGPIDCEVKQLNPNYGKQPSISRCKESAPPPQSATRSFCIVGRFTTRSKPGSKNPQTHQKPTKLQG